MISPQPLGGAFRSAAVLAAVGLLLPLTACGGAKSTQPPPPPQDTTPRWQQAAVFGGPAVWFSVAFTIGGRAYVGTGYDLGNAFWQYDPDGNTWTRRADFPGTARGAAVAFSIGGRGYIATGYTAASDSRFSDLWEYDPTADRWTERAPIPAATRDHAAAFAIGQRGYVVGGMTCGGPDCRALSEVWEYDPSSDRWTRRTDAPQEITGAAVFVLNGVGYLAAGGVGALDAGGASTVLWAYDPQTDTWTSKADLPGAARYRAAGFALNGQGYVGTGLRPTAAGSVGALADLWEYDPAGNAWTRNVDFTGTPRGAAVAFALGARAFIGTGGSPNGQTFTTLRDFWTWTP